MVRLALIAIALVAVAAAATLSMIIGATITGTHNQRILLAVVLLTPAGILMGVPLPAGVRILAARRPDLVPWAWGMNGALSVIGATLAVFFAMNWGFSVTLLAGGTLYLLASTLLLAPLAPADK